jgi:aminotransferase
MNYGNVLTDGVKQLGPSSIKRFFDIINEMPDAISLGLGEPDFRTPGHIRDAGIRSLAEGRTKYTQNPGLPELRRGISAYLARRYGLKYDPETEMCVTVGGSEAIDLAIRCLVEKGDEALVPTPSFVCYSPLVTVCGGTPVELRTGADNGFRVTAKQIRAAITDRTKLLVLPYPSNPTGAILERRDLEEIAEVLRGTDIAVLCDEIYSELTYGQRHCSMASIDGMRGRTVIVNGFSKSFAMTGWRMGYLCGPAELIAPMGILHQYAIMSAPTVTQYAAIEAVENGDGDVEAMKAEYDRRRRLLYGGLLSIGLPCSEPRGAFYCFPRVDGFGLSDADFCERLLLEEKVAIIPGSAFGPGGEGHARCCYAADAEKIGEALRRMEKFVNRLKQGRYE